MKMFKKIKTKVKFVNLPEQFMLSDGIVVALCAFSVRFVLTLP